MVIGKDYDKIEFTFMDLNLVEPNTFISDMFVAFTAFYLFTRMRKIDDGTPFFSFWKWAFLLYSISFFLGGFSHLLFNYTGSFGRIMPFFLGIGISYMIENAMVSLHPKRNLFALISKIKAILATITLIVLIILLDVSEDPSKVFIVPSMNSLIGLVFTLAILSWKYAKEISPAFYKFPISVAVMLPAAIFQSMKISLHQLYDRNDFGHTLVVVSLILYYLAIRGYKNHLQLKTT